MEKRTVSPLERNEPAGASSFAESNRVPRFSCRSEAERGLVA